MKLMRLALLSTVLVFAACKKKEVNATVIVTVLYNGKIVPEAPIYIKKGGAKFPADPKKTYDQFVQANGNGQFIMENVSTDKYYFYSEFNPDTLLKTCKFETTIALRPEPNFYDVRLDVE